MKVSKKLISVFILGAILVFFGCAHNLSTDVIQLQDQVKEQDTVIKTLETDNKDKDQTIEQYKKELEKQSNLASDAEMRAKEASSIEVPLLPPNAKPGDCYARVYVPPTYKTVTEERLKRAASERLEIIPAEYEWVEEKVLVKQASERLETIPAVYGWEEEQVLVKEASYEMQDVPATYDWVEEQILVKPAATVWKKGRGLIEKIDNTTGELMCLVETPAVYKTVKKKVMVTPPTTRSVEIPAEYETVKKKVVLKPPTTRTIEIPAEYKTVKIKKLVTPPKEKRIAIPEEYQTITKTEQVTDARMEWRRVLCETNMSPDVIKQIQKALQDAGHDPKYIDGVIGWRTINATKAYQKEKGLAVGGLTYETIKSLGIQLGA
jgi:hypothetical protein